MPADRRAFAVAQTWLNSAGTDEVRLIDELLDRLRQSVSNVSSAGIITFAQPMIFSSIRVGDGTAALPAISFGGNTGTGVSSGSGGSLLKFSISGSPYLSLQTNGLFILVDGFPITLGAAFDLSLNRVAAGILGVTTFQADAGGFFYWSGRSALRSTVNGRLGLTTNSQAVGVAFDFSVDNILGILKRDESGNAQLYAASVRGVAVAFASVPAAPVEGMLVGVTDSNTAVWGAAIAGGGANHVLAYYNGTSWTVAGK